MKRNQPSTSGPISLIVLFIAAPAIAAQQTTATDFRPRVQNPAFQRGFGPVVMIDEGHNNFHTVSPYAAPHSNDTIPGRLRAFRDLLVADGFRVQSIHESFSEESLSAGSILVISDALADANVDSWVLPNFGAFEEGEVVAVVDWVRQGGALLLIADHQPFAAAAAQLAEAFGVIFNNGFADDGKPGEWDVFSRAEGSLRDHAIVRGRGEEERIDSVATFVGQAFRAAPGTPLEPLLVFPTGSELVMVQDPFAVQANSARSPHIRVDGMLQGAVRAMGRGRLAVFGEAAMFTAQVLGPERRPMGLNHPAAVNNAQFVLNVLHWLARLELEDVR